MILYVMRHGPADDSSQSGKDADRVLSEAGRAVVERAARALRAARGGDLSIVASSPLVRARETAAIVVRLAAAGNLEIEVRSELAPGGSAHELVADLRARGEDVLVVGHQPDVEFLVRTLTEKPGQETRTIPAGFRAGMIVALEPAGEAWRITSVLDPHRMPAATNSRN